MARSFERSPRQRTEWFGGQASMNLTTAATTGAKANTAILLSCPPRLKPSTGKIEELAFPAGIVRGETCSIARMIANVTIYDKDRRQQNISYGWAAGLIKQEVEDDAIADPINTGALVSAPDPLTDLRASWIGHRQGVWNPQATGTNYTVFSVETDLDSTNSRIFESNEVIQFAVEIQTLVNSGEIAPLSLRCVILWRCLLRLD